MSCAARPQLPAHFYTPWKQAESLLGVRASQLGGQDNVPTSVTVESIFY